MARSIRGRRGRDVGSVVMADNENGAGGIVDPARPGIAPEPASA